MALSTSYLPNFPRSLFGKAKPSTASLQARGIDRLREQSLPDLEALLGGFFAEGFFASATAAELARGGPDKKRRESIYTPTTLFWIMLFQVLNPGMACQGVVARVRAWLATRLLNPKRPALGTSAYCDARSALSTAFLQTAFEALRNKVSQQAPDAWQFCGRNVKVIDATNASMPDTLLNQERWPQPSGQKPGCGFPLAKILGVFCLSTGAWLGHALGSCSVHDLSLWHQVSYLLAKGDILLGDAGFCAWSLMAELKARGVDTVFRLHQARSKDMRRGKSLGHNDRLQLWDKPKRPAKSAWDAAMWLALPQQIEVRIIKVIIERKGMRTQCLWLATTLTDPVRYPAAAVAELYYRRWSIELFFRDIKTTMSMDVLRCKSPDMVEKEIYMHATAYNAVRLLILQSAVANQCELGRISFRGALYVIIQWLPKADSYADKPRRLAAWKDEMLSAIAEIKNLPRPDRREPRAKKRRPKNYALLTKPRAEFKEVPHRGKKRAAA